MVQRIGELHVEGGVVFGQHVLAVGLFAHLHIRNWIVAFLEIGEFGDSVFGRAVDEGDRNHGGNAAGDSAGVEAVESELSLALGGEIGRCVPRVDGRTVGGGLFLVRDVPDEVVEMAVGRGRAEVDFVDGVADAVARVGGSV